MKQWFIIFLITMTLQAISQELKIEQKGRYISIRSGNYAMKINAGLGARIVSLTLKSKEVLADKYRLNPNYGSTLWFSPQRYWDWPPSRTLNKGKYDVKTDEKTVVLTSKICHRTGLQFVKTISFDSVLEAFVIRYSIINNGWKEQVIAPWEVTRIRKGCRVFFPLGKKAPLNHFLYTYNTWHYSDAEEPECEGLKTVDGMFDLTVDDRKHSDWFKYYADGAEGWIACQRNDLLFVKRFEDNDYSVLPPDQGEAEVYRHTKHYIEVEQHGRYTRLKPGERMEWEVLWYVREVKGNADRIFVNKILKR